MTIARAYLAAGEPHVEAINLASFGAWCRFVQRPLIWLGKADPAKSVENNVADDPDQNNLAAVLTAWHAAIGDEEVTVKELRKKLTNDLEDVISEVAHNKDGECDWCRFGLWLRRMNGRIAGDLRLSKARVDTDRKQSRWRVYGGLRGFTGVLIPSAGKIKRT